MLKSSKKQIRRIPLIQLTSSKSTLAATLPRRLLFSLRRLLIMSHKTPRIININKKIKVEEGTLVHTSLKAKDTNSETKITKTNLVAQAVKATKRAAITTVMVIKARAATRIFHNNSNNIITMPVSAAVQDKIVKVAATTIIRTTSMPMHNKRWLEVWLHKCSPISLRCSHMVRTCNKWSSVKWRHFCSSCAARLTLSFYRQLFIKRVHRAWCRQVWWTWWPDKVQAQINSLLYLHINNRTCSNVAIRRAINNIKLLKVTNKGRKVDIQAKEEAKSISHRVETKDNSLSIQCLCQEVNQLSTKWWTRLISLLLAAVLKQGLQIKVEVIKS